jgi:hypothetical protein
MTTTPPPDDKSPGGPAEAAAESLNNLRELGEQLGPILAGLESLHGEDGRLLRTTLTGYLGAIEAELKGLLKFAAGVEFEYEEEVDDEAMWEVPAEAVAASLENLRELSNVLGPIVCELKTCQVPDRQAGERITALLQNIEESLQAVFAYEKGRSDA